MRLRAARGLWAAGVVAALLLVAGAAAKAPAGRRRGSALADELPTPIWAAGRSVIWDGGVGGPVTADGVTDAPAEAKLARAAPAVTAAAAAGAKKTKSRLPEPAGASPKAKAKAGRRADKQHHAAAGKDAATAAPAPAPDAAVNDVSSNPLLDDATQFPRYADVRPEHVVPGVRAALAALTRDLDALEARAASGEPVTYASVAEPLERMADRLERTWGVVGHLKGVRDSAELRAAVAEAQPDVVAFELRLGQSRAVYDALRAVRDGPEFAALAPARRRVVELQLRDLELGGVALEGAAKERFNAVQQELATLSTKFSNNVLDATSAYRKVVASRRDVEGLPESALARAAAAARDAGRGNATAAAGPWVFTIDGPSYVSVITYAKSRALREELYRAYSNRASSGAGDNTPVIERMLALRRESAQLLGFDSYAEYSMATKMATLQTANKLLSDLGAVALPHAGKELAELRAFAKAQGEAGELQWWDLSYWAERLRAAKYDLTEEELKPYLELSNVLGGMFKLAKRLFDVDVVAADGKAQVWHPDVRFFEVRAANNGTPIAYLYVDPFARPAEKRGGAWMDSVIGRSALLAPKGQRVRLPVAVAVCNSAPPERPGAPALLTLRDVTTLFHEFGHTLQHMLTTVDDGLVAGIRGVSWDAVEIASQFMENWVTDEATLMSFARHHATGAPMPKALFNRLVAAANFRAASGLARQVNFATKDLELYSAYVPGAGETIYDVEQRVAKLTLVMPLLPDDRSLCSFGHIFTGGYAAGYYSYKWSEVLSADAFAAFEEAGLGDEPAVRAAGRRYRDTILALGGSVPPADVFRRFRGRDPTTAALLRHSGLVGA